MKPYTFIFVGRSGAGKGTQIELLKKAILNKDPKVESYSLDMGNIFRNFMKNEGFAQDQVRQIINSGNLIPDFLTCTLFTKDLLENINSDKNAYIDGFPRSIAQADATIQAIKFFDRKNTMIIDIFITSEEAKKRMILRARPDDNEEAINSRFSFYENSVMPAVEYLKSNSGFNYFKVNGEGTIEDIHSNILKALNF